MRFLYAAFVFALGLSSPALSHSWYTNMMSPDGKRSCCGGSDCAQLPDAAVSAVKGGFVVWWLPKDFPGASTQTFPITIHNADAQPGEDPSHYHMCIYMGSVRCFFFPGASL